MRRNQGNSAEPAGPDDLEVVGESFHQDELWAIAGGRRAGRIRHDIHAVLIAEHDNAHDPNAVSVWIGGRRVGHLSRENAALMRPGLRRLQQLHRTTIALPGVIAGSGSGNLGVFLKYDAEEFGVPPTRRTRPARGTTGNLRTGLSNAVATDAEDDSYDLGWLDTLPGEPHDRVSRLRDLLRAETDLIGRHYLFAELESVLYGRRDADPAALADYDLACRQHDAEMAGIVPALLAKFGVVPLLQTYRQAAIRHQKAKNPELALWWAERGLARYADHPANEDGPRDLHKRAASYRTAVARSRLSRT